MPPANSPDPEQHPPSFISALRELESPVNHDVLNLAATLGTRPDEEEAEVDDARAHLRYLRAASHQFLASDSSVADDSFAQSRERLRLLERQGDELDRRDRLRRVMSRLSRLSDSTGAGATAYGDRVPSQNNLYDWSPANEADDEDELDQILAELRREQPNTHPEILRVLGQSQLDAERARIPSLSSRLPNQGTGAGAGAGTPEGSLRSTAILQSVRRHPRFSARTREYLQRYQSNSEREAANRSSTPTEPPPRHMSHRTLREMLAASRSLRSESPEQERPASESAARHMSMQRLSEGRTSLARERRDMLSRLDEADSYRRSYLERTSLSAPTVSPMLEQTVKYLSRIRHSDTVDESLNCALDAGFLSKDYFCMQYADFVTDTVTIPPPTETSWLAPGAVLSGCQHATSMTATVTTSAPGASTTMHQFRILDGTTNTNPLRHPGLPPPIRPWIWHPNEATTNRASQPSPDPQPSHQDRWPVKVTIHQVDWESMSLSATMEAYNVPSHPHTHSILTSDTPPQVTRTSSITTYLEGEILDFNNHTFLTESFKSSAVNDATYWRKLPPFQNMSDEEVVKALTSRKWFAEVLNKEWILMRWKERCFVKSLNRSTGDSVQPPPATTTSSFPNGPASNPWSSTHYPPTSSTTHPSQLQASPYRIVRNSQTGRAEVEITPQPLFNNALTSDAEHATFDDSGCGLTISGFYYVALDRKTGMLEGLYYDPQSSPYQCLKLESTRGGLKTAWAFR